MLNYKGNEKDMKIVYILKKGFHFYPPCLAQLLFLHDLGVDLEVYHGNTSVAISAILDERGIKHHTLRSDKDGNKTKLQSMMTALAYTCEIKRIIKTVDKDAVLWFGNCESVLTLSEKTLRNRRFVFSVLELDEPNSTFGKLTAKIIHKAEAVLCCEKHRAAMMQVYYGLKTKPYVLPNKPYDLKEKLEEDKLKVDVKDKIAQIKDKFIVLYQGIVTRDRPLDKIARALAKLNDDEIVFVIMGKASNQIQKELLDCYKNTVFMGYIPSPQHLLVTKYAKIGIANYDYSCLNNLYCAPNKIYEYAKFSLPMLTSENIGLTETVGQAGAGECVDFSDVDKIARGIKKILKNQAVYAQNARRFYDETDNFKTIKMIVERLA